MFLDLYFYWKTFLSVPSDKSELLLLAVLDVVRLAQLAKLSILWAGFSVMFCDRTGLLSLGLADDKELLLTPESLDFSLKHPLPKIFPWLIFSLRSLFPPTTYLTDVNFWSASQVSSMLGLVFFVRESRKE